MICKQCKEIIDDSSTNCIYCGCPIGQVSSMTNQINRNAGARAMVLPSILAEKATEDERAFFIQKTYTHLSFAILAFIILETLILNWSGAENLAVKMTNGYNWLIVLGLFMGVGWIADKWAKSDVSIEMQYLGLAIYVIAEAVIFMPLLYIAKYEVGSKVIGTAGFISILLFAGLSFIAFSTKKDFSFMRNVLIMSGFIALGLIIASIIFGFNLGLLFSFVMVAFAAGSILYETSNIIHHYRTDQYVAASLGLFASVMLLFWYILRILLALWDD